MNCSFDGCDRPRYAKELCQTHYMQKRAGKELRPIQGYKYRNTDVCTVDNCKRPYYSKGFCNMHYYRSRNGIALDAPIRGH